LTILMLQLADLPCFDRIFQRCTDVKGQIMRPVRKYYCFKLSSNSIGTNRGPGRQCLKILIFSSVGSPRNLGKFCGAILSSSFPRVNDDDLLKVALW